MTDYLPPPFYILSFESFSQLSRSFPLYGLVSYTNTRSLFVLIIILDSINYNSAIFHPASNFPKKT